MLLVTGEAATASSCMTGSASAAESASRFEAEMRRCVARQPAFGEPNVVICRMPDDSLTVGRVCNFTPCQPPAAATCRINQTVSFKNDDWTSKVGQMSVSLRKHVTLPHSQQCAVNTVIVNEVSFHWF